MQAKIDTCGELWIKRGGKLRLQECPFLQGAYCGDWCPLFGEPHREVRYSPEVRTEQVLCLCQKRITGTITDERATEGD